MFLGEPDIFILFRILVIYSTPCVDVLFDDYLWIFKG